MVALLRDVVAAQDGQIGLIDAAWEDFPWLDGDDTWFEVQADSLLDHAGPPYPGVSVATVTEDAGARDVVVEVLHEERPEGLRLVHTVVLGVGSQGALIGPPLRMSDLPLPAGEYDLEIWVDADTPREVRHVCFAFVGTRPAPFGPPVPPPREPAPVERESAAGMPPVVVLALGVLLVVMVFGGAFLQSGRVAVAANWQMPLILLAFIAVVVVVARLQNRD